MKKTALFLLLAALCLFALAGTALAGDIADSSYCKSFNMNAIPSGSTYYGINCGPTAAAEIIAYWDLRPSYLKDLLWEPDSDLTGTGVNPNLHLCDDLNTTVGVGTTPANWQAGMLTHLNGTCGNPSPANGATPNYASSATTLYQKSAGVTYTSMWNTIKAEIDANRPVALYIGHYPSGYVGSSAWPKTPAGSLYRWYNYHWQCIYGYTQSGSTYVLHTRTGFGSSETNLNFGTYWNFTYKGKSIDNIAICTVTVAP